ncbi:c-type cytochrome [Cognatishimia maritima]|uniref:Cytochrome c2 n=1 Tax=Cognatishimia maritima TaxID=870908 RepID=A0A1M5IQG8_9RHOB|nr:cytochrome c family protein [Cognatishimia maritima]SHG30552.1 Cytochrome c2 [Cognatishimia maritima]
MRWFSVCMPFLLLASPLASQDAQNGEVIFKKCSACHAVGDGAKNKTGPVLTGVVGRAAGSVDGYKYGSGMQQAGANGLIWDEAHLTAYLEDPRAFLRAYLDDPKAKAKMTFKLKDSQDRRDVVAYLAGFSTHEDARVCIMNKAEITYFFVAESAAGERLTQRLAQGDVLCATGGAAGARAVVSVFQDESHLEGCSRLTPMGQTETLVRYVDFDRCEWGSHNS